MMANNFKKLSSEERAEIREKFTELIGIFEGRMPGRWKTCAGKSAQSIEDVGATPSLPSRDQKKAPDEFTTRVINSCKYWLWMET
ncbi:hypothetical protein DMENIID0001_113890 [Sergentomyia squamirostris]